MKIINFIIGLFLGILIISIPFNQFQSSTLEPLQTLAVQFDGRKKPLDTVARETVAQIHGKLNYQTTNKEDLDYLQIYLSLWFNNRDWNEEPFILFSYRPLKEKVGLNPEQKYFSFVELMESKLGSFVLATREKQNNEQDLNRDEREALALEERLALMIDTVGQNTLPLIPHPTDIKGTWVSINRGSEYYQPNQIEPLLTTYTNLKQTYKIHPEQLSILGEISQKLQTQLRNLSNNIYPTSATLKQEVNFYKLHPFRKAWILYTFAFSLMLIILLFPSFTEVTQKPGLSIKSPDLKNNHDNKPGFLIGLRFNLYWLIIGTFISGLLIQTYGFWERMQIAGRPPVTNMYESVIWVGFGIAAIALLFELIYRAKYYLLAAAPLSIFCLLLADNLPAVLDPSIKPLVPVLRDNFWLSIHVPTITLSYASFALAFGLGHILLGNYLFTPQSKPRIKSLAKWNYGVLQTGVLLLATGIILGGIWAHFSWGRFWGWDPKETWALIALMCYIIPLHGRLIGWLKDFGLTVTSVLSFNAVLMAWYGVNFVLGTGLHSYGFSTGGSELIVGSFVAFDLLLLLIVFLRHRSSLSAEQTLPPEEKTTTFVETSNQI
ncbi:cytochrome c biogenesis protein CcsA [Okeania sp.]|uniref:cytochrome c biogenesis protein n=1 Tax=Okeania sp. TaxID=3100323 RepID=UPI002B4B859B|nr:cytochrome c biogenesis protein CcsA [Okeania sp.]MEB3342082.1 cytochrome c biogenesis protein CcsA [Okeania sp.]